MADDHGWGRKFIERCGIDPDDDTAVRSAFESCRESHGRWLRGEGDMDRETYYMLVDAIRDLYDWTHFPFEWGPVYLVRLAEPLRDVIPRIPSSFRPKPEFPAGQTVAERVTAILEAEGFGTEGR